MYGSWAASRLLVTIMQPCALELTSAADTRSCLDADRSSVDRAAGSPRITIVNVGDAHMFSPPPRLSDPESGNLWQMGGDATPDVELAEITDAVSVRKPFKKDDASKGEARSHHPVRNRARQDSGSGAPAWSRYRSSLRTPSTAPEQPPEPPRSQGHSFLIDGSGAKRVFPKFGDAIAEVRKLLPSTPAEREGQPMMFWLDIVSPSEAEMEELSELFDLHPLTTDDCIEEATRDKWEQFHNYMVVGISPYNSPGHHDVMPYILAVVFSSCIITFHNYPVTICDKIANSLDPGAGLPSPDWVVMLLLNSVVEVSVIMVMRAQTEVDTLEQLACVLNTGESSDLLARISRCRTTISHLRRFLLPKRDVLTSLATKGDLPLMTRQVRLYLRNVTDDIIIQQQRLDTALDMLNTLQSMYFAQLSVQMADSSHQLNLVMQKLSVVATVMLPLSVITGLFGMNVTVPGQTDRDGNYWWFISIVAAMFLIVLLAWRYFKRMGWLT